MSRNWPPIEVVKPIGFEVVVHSWLKDEWYKPEYQEMDKNLFETLIRYPDFQSSEDNQKRLQLLRLHRHNMITPTIENADWYKIRIKNVDIDRLFHCPIVAWGTISDNTFLVKSTIRNIFPPHFLDNSISVKIHNIHSSITADSKISGIILVGKDFNSVFTIIEGNHRITAFSESIKDKGDDALISDSAYLGLSLKIDQYDLHIGKYFHEV